MGRRSIQVDVAVIGAGAAGLSLLAHLGEAGWRGTLALIDDGRNEHEARSWAWWSQGELLADRGSSRVFANAVVAGDGWERELALAPYAYRTVTGEALRGAATAPGRAVHALTRVAGVATRLRHSGARTEVDVTSVDGSEVVISAARVFDSVGVGAPSHARVARLDFLGWEVRSADPAFDADEITLMDFRTDQTGGLSFMYVLPMSSTHALVERTTFVMDASTPDHSPHLARYVAEVLPPGLEGAAEVERGTIPLVAPHVGHLPGVTPIGVPAGAVKASSGYAFARIQRHSAEIAAAMVGDGGAIGGASSPRWFAALDRALLTLIREDPDGGRRVLEALLRKAEPSQILRFLDEELGLREQLLLGARLPFWLFPRASIRAVMRGHRAG